MYSATKEFAFEAGHTLYDHKGKCKNLHGHNYKVLVTMSSKTLNNLEMVADFYDLKRFADTLFDKFDHSFMVNMRDINKEGFEQELLAVLEKYQRKITYLPFRSTAENLSKLFFDELNKGCKEMFGDAVTVTKVTVYETSTSFATYEEG